MRLWGICLIGLCLLVPLTAQATDIQRVVSDHNIEAWLVEDHSLPVISISMAFRGGSAADPKGKEGLNSMLAALLVEGAGAYPAQEFQQQLEDHSISLSFDVDRDYLIGSLKTLSAQKAKAFELLQAVVQDPVFAEDSIEQVRQQMMTQLNYMADDPVDIARMNWWQTAYPDHGYGHLAAGTKESIAALTRDDVTAYKQAVFARDNLVIGVVGDITAEELSGILDQIFANLPAHETLQMPPARTMQIGSGIVDIERDIPQSTVMFGQKGISRDNPDFYAAYVLNYILGGSGLSSRLMTEVRKKRGLAYSVYSYLLPLEHSDLIVGQVASDRTKISQALDIIRSEWRRMKLAGPTEGELDSAKKYLTGSFVLRFDTTQNLADFLVGVQIADLGIDYLEKRNSYINAVTLDQIKKVAHDVLDPDQMLFVVVGQPIALPEPEDSTGATPVPMQKEN